MLQNQAPLIPGQADDVRSNIRLFVRITPNILAIQPPAAQSFPDESFILTLEHALTRGMQATFQVEASELTAEPLGKKERRDFFSGKLRREGSAFYGGWWMNPTDWLRSHAMPWKFFIFIPKRVRTSSRKVRPVPVTIAFFRITTSASILFWTAMNSGISCFSWQAVSPGLGKECGITNSTTSGCGS